MKSKSHLGKTPSSMISEKGNKGVLLTGKTVASHQLVSARPSWRILSTNRKVRCIDWVFPSVCLIGLYLRHWNNCIFGKKASPHRKVICQLISPVSSNLIHKSTSNHNPLAYNHRLNSSWGFRKIPLLKNCSFLVTGHFWNISRMRFRKLYREQTQHKISRFDSVLNGRPR